MLWATILVGLHATLNYWEQLVCNNQTFRNLSSYSIDVFVIIHCLRIALCASVTVIDPIVKLCGEQITSGYTIFSKNNRILVFLDISQRKWPLIDLVITEFDFFSIDDMFLIKIFSWFFFLFCRKRTWKYIFYTTETSKCNYEYTSLNDLIIFYHHDPIYIMWIRISNFQYRYPYRKMQIGDKFSQLQFFYYVHYDDQFCQ